MASFIAVALFIGGTTTSAASYKGKHRCGRIDGVIITGYNMSCRRTRSVWQNLPDNWSGANLDVDGGFAYVCPSKYADRVAEARRGRKFSLSALDGVPVASGNVPYGE